MWFLLPIFKLLGNTFLTPLLGYFQNKDTIKARMYASEVSYLIEQNRARAEVLISDSQHPLLWIPKSILFFSVTAWVAAVFLDSIFDFSWTVLDVPSNFWNIVYAVVGYMTLDTTSRNIGRWLK